MVYGAYNSEQVEANIAKTEAFAKDRVVLNCDRITAKLYGELRHDLKRKGRPIPENDLWIAAITRQHNLILVTRDTHFDAIDSIQKESW